MTPTYTTRKLVEKLRAFAESGRRVEPHYRPDQPSLHQADMAHDAANLIENLIAGQSPFHGLMFMKPTTENYGTLRGANAARQKEWDKDGKISLSYRGNELAGETGEACNKIKKLERERLGIKGSRTTVKELASELADVIICTDLVAMEEGIDLDEAVKKKFNETSEELGLRTRLV